MPRTVVEQASKPERGRDFADMVYVYDAQVKSHLRRSFPGLRDVDDVVQESYLRIWRVWATRPISSAKGLLFTVARRVALNLMRSRRRSPFAGELDGAWDRVPSGQPNAADAAAITDDLERLVDAVDALPARCREIFVLRRIDGLSPKDIAARLGLSEQTVQVQLGRGLRKVEAHFRARAHRGP